MPHTRSVWDNDERTCYRIEFLDGWTWADFSRIHRESYAMLAKEKREIDLIVVFVGGMPPDSAMGHLAAGGNQPANVRHTVMVNSTNIATKLFVQSMVDVIVSVEEWVGPKFVDSLEEARLYLAGLTQQ